MKRVIVLILLVLMLLMSCSFFANEQGLVWDFTTELSTVNQYSINCYFDEREKLLKGYECLTYYNNGETILQDIYMHLYPNAFEKIDTAPFGPKEYQEAYPLGFDIGFINIDGVRVDGGQADWKYRDDSRQVMRVKLPTPLGPGDHATIDINFTVKFPRCNARFGYGEKTIKAANWYPIAAVFDERGWNLDPYHAIGDPFYSDCADYLVNLVVPVDYEVASTGQVIKKKKLDGGRREWTIEAQRVRDFAWIASEEFKVSSKKVDGITVKSYYFDRPSGKKALQVAADAICIFNECFGAYPYRTYSVVAADFFVGGMEYPNLVLISKELYNNERLFTLEYVTVHETAHQWWYGVVGSNQLREAWLDEGLTEYSTILYYEKRYGTGTAEGLMQNMIKSRYYTYTETAASDIGIYNSLEDYRDSEQYHTLVYCGGAILFHELRQLMGEQDFFEALQVYYKSYAFDNATAQDFIQVVDHISPLELERQVRQWLELGM